MNISTAYFNLVDSELKGRCVCCVKPISAGTIILNEPTLATVLYGPSRNIFCSFCTARLENSFFFLSFLKKKLLAKVVCSKCHSLFYCSEECLSKDLLIHKFECRAYRRGWKQGKQIDDDSDEFEYSDSFYNLQDFLKDSDDLHLLRVLSVLHNNEIFHKQMQSTYGGIKSVFNSVGALYADNIENIDSVVSHFEAQSVTSYPRLVPFADLTPIERIFDLVGHAHSTETELEEQKNIIYKALTFLKFF